MSLQFAYEIHFQKVYQRYSDTGHFFVSFNVLIVSIQF